MNKPSNIFHIILLFLQDAVAEIVAESPEPEYKPEPVVNNKRKSTICIEELAEEITPKSSKLRNSYNSRTRASSPSTSISSEYINPSSVQSSTSDDSFSTHRPAKRRGRPPKPVPSLLDPNEIANLSPEDLKYRELRNKNNEASRRSRLNRKDKETQIEEEARELETQFNMLESEERKLIRKCAQWREAVMKLALL